MIKILIVEDDANIAKLVEATVAIGGYEGVVCTNGAEAFEKIEHENFDLILLDVMLPDMSGFEIMQKRTNTDSPVIFITAKQELTDKVRGLRLGAEDYIVKPFEMLELLVRIDNILKRCGKDEPEEIHIRDVVVNEKKRTVQKNGVDIPMQPMEFDCLLVFWKYRNRVISRDQILNILWGVDFEGESRTVDVHVGNIRKKLDFSDVIITVPRVGYRMEVPEWI